MRTAGRWLTCAGLLIAIACWDFADADERHAHDGVLTPYTDGPPEVDLSNADLAKLSAGATLIRRIRVDGDNRALAAVRVNATPSMIWSVLLDFDEYPEWAEGLEVSEIYKHDGNDIYVTFHYRHWLVGSVKYHVHHNYPGSATGWGTWTLDYRRRSDLYDTVGFWRVVPVAGDPERADVIYSTRIRLDGWLAGWMEDWFIEDTLRTVTTGLKSRAESKQSASTR